jgi:hypothetical protein
MLAISRHLSRCRISRRTYVWMMNVCMYVQHVPAAVDTLLIMLMITARCLGFTLVEALPVFAGNLSYGSKALAA